MFNKYHNCMVLTSVCRSKSNDEVKYFIYYGGKGFFLIYKKANVSSKKKSNVKLTQTVSSDLSNHHAFSYLRLAQEATMYNI